MEDAGQKLKRARERLGLRYRDVEEFSQRVAESHRNGEFTIAISRLSDIENRGVVPNIYKMYSLCAIYRLEMAEVLRWYGVDLGSLPSDATLMQPMKSHVIGFGSEGMGQYSEMSLQAPLALDPGIDLTKTSFLSRYIQSWGVLPAMLLSGLDLKGHRYGFLGLDDWFMYPLLNPGSLLLIDESRNKIASSGWTNEFDRPIYMLEYREGWVCAWCSQEGDRLVALPHPASNCTPIVFDLVSEVEVVGRVMGVANRLQPGLRPPGRP